MISFLDGYAYIFRYLNINTQSRLHKFYIFFLPSFNRSSNGFACAHSLIAWHSTTLSTGTVLTTNTFLDEVKWWVHSRRKAAEKNQNKIEINFPDWRSNATFWRVRVRQMVEKHCYRIFLPRRSSRSPFCGCAIVESETIGIYPIVFVHEKTIGKLCGFIGGKCSTDAGAAGAVNEIEWDRQKLRIVEKSIHNG